MLKFTWKGFVTACWRWVENREVPCLNNLDYLIALDIGTSKIRVIIGEYHSNTVHVIGVGSAPSQGIKKGAIVDIDLTVEAIKQAVAQAEQMVDVRINEVAVGISGNHIELLSGHGVVAVSSEDREITDTDIERVLQASRVIALPPDREVIDIVPREFIVDGLRDIRDPRGMIGVRLEVETTIVTGSKTWLHNLHRCIERAGLSITGYVLMPLAAAEVALSADEKKLGVVLIDLGAGSTDIAYFENGVLMKTIVLPIGGDYITNDIAIGLRTQTEVAERIKLAHGHALAAVASDEETFKVPRIGSQNESTHSQAELADIIEPRVEEIFYLIRQAVEQTIEKEPPGGYVLVGGTVSLPGMREMAEAVLGGTVRIAQPEFVGLRDPSYVNGAGMILYLAKRATRPSAPPTEGKSKGVGKKKIAPKSSPLEKVKNWLKEFI